MDHGQEILNELIRPFEGGTDLAEGSQILVFDLIEGLWITHKEPDCRIGRELVETMRADRSLHLSLLEGFQVAIETSLCSTVALFLDFTPQGQTIPLSVLPAFEHIGRKGVKGTLPLAPFFGFGKGSSFEPVAHRPFSQIKPLRNLLGLHALLV